ncbi:MAG: hypothetical protein ACI9LX_000096 [Paraglaciecola sp.]|jgi:hypothetical protein
MLRAFQDDELQQVTSKEYDLKNQYFIRFRDFLKLTGKAFKIKKYSIVFLDSPGVVFTFEPDGVVVKRPLLPLRKITYARLNFDRLLNLGISPV